MSSSVHKGPAGEPWMGLMYRGLWETDDGYVEKAVEMGSFSIGASLGNPERGSFTGDFERLMKVALEMERLSLRELCEGNLEGDPERYAK